LQNGENHQNLGRKIKSKAVMVQNTETFAEKSKAKLSWCRTPKPLQQIKSKAVIGKKH